MNAAQLDDNGVVVACPNCGQKNRIQYEKLNQTVRCGKCKTGIPGAAAPIDVDSEQHFNTLIGLSPLPVLVDFWAQWCGPCKMAEPEFEKVAESQAGKLIVAKVDTDKEPGLAHRYSIHAIPTMILFQHGQESANTSGAMPAKAIQKFVEDSLAHAKA